ncbi:CoB--CoM heterodisulfide reductase iron-sulfur subunit A family protein [bacterium]|nr:CoB--CoM heterodisulfide reductase iron-sulfur subunit A family protein [bacterium]
MSENGKKKIGVYICHCGTNISQTVDVKAVAEYAWTLPDVHLSRTYQYMCSDPGQALIQKDIEEQGLTHVVVSSCSPLMHERTFRRAVAEAGVNPYLFAMANIREQVSWVHTDKAKATEKAKRLIAATVFRVSRQEELFPETVDVNPAVLIIGAGIAGIEAALKCAIAGKKVYLVEKEPSVGGHMAFFDKTFPTLDCAACILTPKMVDVGIHPNIELLTWSEVTKVDGYIGNFTVTVKKKARHVDIDLCNSCGDCVEACPAIMYPDFKVVEINNRLIKQKDPSEAKVPVAPRG